MENKTVAGKIVTFSSGGREYGVGAFHAMEVLKRGEIRGVPKSAEYVSGIINLRGSIIPVLDIERFFGKKCGFSHGKILVIGDGKNLLLGLLADSVGGLVDVPAESMQKYSAGKAGGILDVSIGDKRRITLLDMENLLAGL